MCPLPCICFSLPGMILKLPLLLLLGYPTKSSQLLSGHISLVERPGSNCRPFFMPFGFFDMGTDNETFIKEKSIFSRVMLCETQV